MQSVHKSVHIANENTRKNWVTPPKIYFHTTAAKYASLSTSRKYIQVVNCFFLDRSPQNCVPKTNPRVVTSIKGTPLRDPDWLPTTGVPAPPPCHLLSSAPRPLIHSLLIHSPSRTLHHPRRKMKGETMLHLAAFNGHTSIVEVHLNRGANINARNGALKTPLHLAAANGQTDVVKLLLHWGANTAPRAQNGMTAHYFAEQNGHAHTADLLRGLPGAEHTVFGETELHRAAAVGELDRARTLLDEGADIDARDDNGMTALHLAAQLGHVAAVRLLLEYAAEIEADVIYGERALHLAAKHGRCEVVLELLGSGCDIAAKAEDGTTALHVAARDGHASTLLALLDLGANIEAANIRGETALHLALMNRSLDAMVALLCRGADITATTSLGKSVLVLATHPSDRDMLLAELSRRAAVERESAEALAQGRLPVARSAVVVQHEAVGDSQGDTTKPAEEPQRFVKVGKRAKVWHLFRFSGVDTR